MLTLLLAESELEQIPQSIQTNPRVITSAKHRGKHASELLLDSSVHHTAMGRLVEKERRGRPDITHLFLLVSLESIVNKHQHLKVIIHTRNDEVITVDPSTRMIKNYDRFLGLMEQLFTQHVVPNTDHPLLSFTQHVALPQLLNKIHGEYVIACSLTGKPVKLPQYFTALKNKNYRNLVYIIGGFPHGEFHTDMTKIADDVISIYPEMLPAWTVAGELLVNYENIFL